MRVQLQLNGSSLLLCKVKAAVNTLQHFLASAQLQMWHVKLTLCPGMAVAGL